MRNVTHFKIMVKYASLIDNIDSSYEFVNPLYIKGNYLRFYE